MLGIVRIGICVTEPCADLAIPALSYKEAKSEYKYPGYPLRPGISPLLDENSRNASQYDVTSV